jgi:hypothetical protein
MTDNTIDEKTFIILLCIGLFVAAIFLLAPYFIHDEYPDACINWNYVKGIGAHKSDYYYDTDLERCNKACSYIPSKNDNPVYRMTQERVCDCCKARG